MNEKEALARIKTGDFSNGCGFDMQLLVDAVGTIGEMLKSGQISEVIRCKDCKIEKAPTIGGWISVKDRLPTESGQYLVYIRHWQCDGFTEVCGFDADKKEFGKIDMDYVYDNDGWYSVNYVTHWQKLPEAPKEEQHG